MPRTNNSTVEFNQFLKVCAALCRTNGFVSQTEASERNLTSTSTLALNVIRTGRTSIVEEVDEELVEKALGWLEDLDSNRVDFSASQTWEDRAVAAVARRTVADSNAALVASVIGKYYLLKVRQNRIAPCAPQAVVETAPVVETPVAPPAPAPERQRVATPARRARRTRPAAAPEPTPTLETVVVGGNQWRGALRQTLEVVARVAAFRGPFHSNFGNGSFHYCDLLDAEGNRYTFATTQTFEVGSRHTFRGRVKEHRDYRGLRTTVMNYVESVEVHNG